jgi:uncharacterized protein (TIGR03437 family)
MEMSKSILMLWPTLRDDPALAASDRQTIENWIVNQLMTVAYIPGGVNGAFPYTNNWGYFGASIQMANAIRRSDHQTFANAIQEFYVALNQMRPDGSFPDETSRGPCSATYTNVAILHLTSIAEMAAAQGYDLYGLNGNGKNLEAAIEFLLNARENPSLLYQCSKMSTAICFLSPSDPLDFQDVFNNGVPNNLAWVEAYLARFPFSSTAARLRQIVGSNLTAPPFPMWNSYVGLNATCAFRKPFEFKPANGVKILIGSGNNQTVAPNQVTPAPLTVRVTDSSGAPLANVLVSFAVVQGSANLMAPAQVLTDANGLASATVTAGPLSGTATVTATALGTAVSFSLVASGPAIDAGGILGIGASVPGVTTISPWALFSIDGHDLAPAGTGVSASLADGPLPTTLAGVCVTVGGLRAPIQAVNPSQINVVAPAVTPGSTVAVSVTTGCGTPGAKQTVPQLVVVASASPEFFYLAHNANGQNPVVAVNAISYAYLGPAQPGDLVIIFGSGFGPTNPPITPGAIATGAAQVTVQSP